MSVLSLEGARQARTVATVEAILAQINEQALPEAARDALDRQARKRPGRRVYDDARLVYVWPSAQKVAALVREKGSWAARERWSYVSERELQALAKEGGASLDQGDEP